MTEQKMPEELWVKCEGATAATAWRVPIAAAITGNSKMIPDGVKYIREDVAQEAAYLPEAAEANFKALWEGYGVTGDDLTQSAQKLKERLQAIVRETGWKPTTELTQDFIGWLTKQRCIAEQHLRKEKNND